MAALAEGVREYPFWGPADESAPKIVTPSGVTVFPNGFDREKKKKLIKARKHLERRKVAEHIITAFEEYSRSFWSTPNIISDSIEKALAFNLKQWRDCGGKYAEAANKFNPKRLTVNIVPHLFLVQNAMTEKGIMDEVWANGVCMANGLLIKAVPVGFRAGYTQLAGFPGLMQWECGNAIACQSKFYDKEYGSLVPCQI